MIRDVDKTVNFYSSKDEVVVNGDGDWHTILKRNFMWYNQETRKGVWPLMLHDNEGGWAFNPYHDTVTGSYVGNKYFESVIKWVNTTFPFLRGKLMKGLPWGIYFNKYGEEERDPDALEKRIAQLLRDDEDVGDITNQRGIYEYLLSGDERHLNIRRFSDKMARTAYERQGGNCVKCGKHFAIEEMQADHITPWAKGGKTVAENCQMLCADCNRRKSDV